jgi:tol-pal system protein YbgF
MVPKCARPRLAASLLGFALAPLLAGCGGGKSAQEKQLDELRDELSHVQQTSDRFEERLGKLELDEADSKGDTPPAPSAQLPPARSKAAPVATPPLRVVRIGPDGAEETAASSETASDASDPNDTSPRPVIRIQGSGTDATITDEKGRRVRRGGQHVEHIEETIPSEGGAGGQSGQGGRPSALDADARRAYDAALALVNAHKYPEALDAFAGFLVRWPDHPNADNAMFWRGECYFARGEYNRAAEQYEGVLARFPLGNKVPDALLKLGMARAKLGNPQASREAFEKLRHDHPRSEAARRIPAEETP